MAGNEYNQVKPHQSQNPNIVAGSPLAVLGLLLEVLRERFAEGNGLDLVWRPDITTTDIFIEIGYNAETDVRDGARALYINRLNSSPRPLVVGDRVGVHLPDHYEGFIAEMHSQYTIDCVSQDKGDSMLLSDIVQHFLLAVRQIMGSQYGIHDFGMPESGQTSPFDQATQMWSTTVSFQLSYFVRWSTVKIRPLLQQVSITVQDDPDDMSIVALNSINRIGVAAIDLKTRSAATPTPLVGKYSALLGDGTSTQYDVEHGLGTEQVVVSVFQEISGEEVPFTLYRLGPNTVRLIFQNPPTLHQLRVVVVG